MKPWQLCRLWSALFLGVEAASVLQHASRAKEDLHVNAISRVRQRSHFSRFLHTSHQNVEVNQQTKARAARTERHNLEGFFWDNGGIFQRLEKGHALSALVLIALACLMAGIGVYIWSTWAPPDVPKGNAPPQNLDELFESQTAEFRLPETVYGDAVLHFTICASLHSDALRRGTGFPVAAWCRSILCLFLIIGACFVQVFVCLNLDVKLAQERFGLREALKLCQLPLAASCSNLTVQTRPRMWPDTTGATVYQLGKNCCTRDQVCGEVSWRYFCADRSLVKPLYKDPFGTDIWGSMACSFQKVSDTYYEFEDTVYPRWQWLVSCILFLWLCLMAKDARASFMLYRAITSRPKVSFASEQIVQQGKEVEIVGMTNTTCFAILIAAVVPKFMVVLYVTYVGSRLLISSSGVLDLVLDGVALMFLIEADQVLFYGLTGSIMREVLRNSKPLTFRINNFSLRFVNLFGLDMSMIFVSSAILFLILYIIRSESGIMGSFIESACAP